MAVLLNHIIIWRSDKQRSAAFLTDMLGLPPAIPFHHFLVVELANQVSIDFMEKNGPVSRQHYALLLGEEEFDALLARIRQRRIDHWADPARTMVGAINNHDGGRGVYWEDPDGHLLEAITRPYGRGEYGTSSTAAANVPTG